MEQPGNPYQAPRVGVADPRQEYAPMRIFSVSGRLGRLRYLAYSMGVPFLILVPLLIVAAVLGAIMPPLVIVGIILGGIGYVAVIVLQFIFTIRRCHDFDTSGWLSLLLLVPLAPFVFWFIPGTTGANRYGNPPPPNSGGVIAVVLLPLIVIPIIGILAAIAIPQYQEYTVRARTAEAAVMLEACSMSVTQFTASKGSWPSTLEEAGCHATAAHADLALNPDSITATIRNTGAQTECSLALTANNPSVPTRWMPSYSGCNKKHVPSRFQSVS